MAGDAEIFDARFLKHGEPEILLAVRNERAPRFAAAAPQSCDELLMPTASGHLLFAVLGDDGK